MTAAIIAAMLTHKNFRDNEPCLNCDHVRIDHDYCGDGKCDLCDCEGYNE